jgi:hypothetical protein
MNKYYVGLTIHNTFVVKASGRQDAEEKVRNLSIEDTLDDADYEITYVDELREEYNVCI